MIKRGIEGVQLRENIRGKGDDLEEEKEKRKEEKKRERGDDP